MSQMIVTAAESNMRVLAASWSIAEEKELKKKKEEKTSENRKKKRKSGKKRKRKWTKMNDNDKEASSQRHRSWPTNRLGRIRASSHQRAPINVIAQWPPAWCANQQPRFYPNPAPSQPPSQVNEKVVHLHWLAAYRSNLN